MTTKKAKLITEIKADNIELVGNEQESIIHKINQIEDPSLLIKINHFIDESAKTEQKDEYDELLEHILDEIGGDNEPLKHHIHEETEDNPLEKFEHFLALPLFIASIAMLTVLGLILFVIVGNDRFEPNSSLVNILYTAYWILEVLFLIEFLIILYLRNTYAHSVPKRQVFYRFLMLIFPPFRIAKGQLLHPDRICLPFLGWTKNNDALFEHLRRKFSMPMIMIALLIIPILIVDWRFTKYLNEYAPQVPIDMIIILLQAFIWVAFTFEFTLMISITKDKKTYCQENWMDILIILLPLISFFRSARTLRALRVNSLARTYRVRGIILKAREALILAEAVQKLLYPNPNKQLITLQKKLRKNNRQRKDLEYLVLMAIERIKKKEAKNKGKKTNKVGRILLKFKEASSEKSQTQETV